MEPTPQQKNKNEVEQWGGIFGITVVVMLIVAGGIYFLYSQYQKIQQEKLDAQTETNL